MQCIAAYLHVVDVKNFVKAIESDYENALINGVSSIIEQH